MVFNGSMRRYKSELSMKEVPHGNDKRNEKKV